MQDKPDQGAKKTARRHFLTQVASTGAAAGAAAGAAVALPVMAQNNNEEPA